MARCFHGEMLRFARGGLLRKGSFAREEFMHEGRLCVSTILRERNFAQVGKQRVKP